MANAAESMKTPVPGDKIITDDDLSHVTLDENQGTVNQMTGGSAEGSGAGGTGSDSDNMTEIDEGSGKTPADKATVDRTPAAPAEGMGKGKDTKTDSGAYGY